MSNLKWISSHGGPLILMQSQHASKWGGALPKPAHEMTDYEYGCHHATSYIDLLSISNKKALIMVEPILTSLILSANRDKNFHLIARWNYAPSYDVAEYWLSKLDCGVFPQPNFNISLSEGEIILFDSAYSGEEILNGVSDSIRIQLNESGEYGVSTYQYKPSKEIWLTLHKLELTL